ncbi:MAG: hypothetical protein H6699_10720 [Myxococcales bacterium]|nr:hypothetical protein [Myxococcales bacterium]
MSRPRLLTALLVATALALGAPAAAQRVDAARSAAMAADQGYQAAVDELDAARNAFERESEAINRMKDGSATAFDVFELQRALRRAQAAAEELSDIDARVRSERADAEAANRALVAALQEELRSAEARLEQAAPEARGALAARVAGLRDEVAARSAPLPPYSPVPIAAIVAGLSDSPDELYDAVAELTDYEARLRRQLDDVRERLRLDAIAARVQGAEQRLSAEESFFDEEGIRRVGSRSARPAATAMQDDDANAAPSTPTTTPIGDDRGVTAGAAEDSAGGMESDFGAPEAATEPVAFPGTVLTPAPVTATAVDVAAGTPTSVGARSLEPQVEAAGTARSGRGRSRAAQPLSALAAQLEAELTSVQAERARLERQAAMFEEALQGER